MNVPNEPLGREGTTAAVPGLAERVAADPRRVVVFDDDPTGTQTVSDVDVLLDATHERIAAFFAAGTRCIYVLTNTRALSRGAAIAHLADLHKRFAAVARRFSAPWTPLLRGDSTLRGHVFAEIDAIAPSDAVILFVPAFPEGGRTTLGGQQLIRIDGENRNVALTEYARDPDFGYRSLDLRGWVREVGGGRASVEVGLPVLRERGSAAVTAALLDAAPGTVVIPDAVEGADIEAIAVGLMDAEAAGRSVVVRSASTFAAVRCGLIGRVLDHVEVRSPGRLLIACGSHTAGSRAQLAGLTTAGLEIEPLDRSSTVDDLVQTLAARLDRFGIAAVATPRDPLPRSDLAAGAELMLTLATVAERLSGKVDGVVAKGGITSAAVAVALGAQTARVEGQLLPGVALWTLDRMAGGIPYAVVPGNVGDNETLVRLVAAMGRPIGIEPHRPDAQ